MPLRDPPFGLGPLPKPSSITPFSPGTSQMGDAWGINPPKRNVRASRP
jgi:hypothetical protein